MYDDFAESTSGQMFFASAGRLTMLAREALHSIHVPRNELVLYCIAVDSCWRNVVDVLNPKENWQSVRDRGQHPLAIGAATWRQLEPLTAEIPELLQARNIPLDEHHVRVVVVHDGGFSIAQLLVPDSNFLH